MVYVLVLRHYVHHTSLMLHDADDFDDVCDRNVVANNANDNARLSSII